MTNARVFYAPSSRVTLFSSSSFINGSLPLSPILYLGILFSLIPFFFSIIFLGKLKGKMLFMVFFLFFTLGQCSVDYNALLSFKDSVFDPSNSLSSWANSSNPCSDSWYGVTCNPSAHRVTRLVLENLNLSGSTRSLHHLSHLRLLSLKNNRFFSSSRVNLSSWRYLRHLYLRGNLFSGTFPTGISTLRRLHRLDLSHNDFHGEIPMAELTQLPYLLTLRLESNSFTGPLNSILSFSCISDFNVSDNSLSGDIPSWMSRFPISSFEGNKALCGHPLPSDCFNRTALPASITQKMHHPETKRLSNEVILMIIAVDAVAVMTAIVSVTWCCYKYKCLSQNEGTETKSGSNSKSSRPNSIEAEELVVLEGCKGFRKVGDLLKSSAELLGKGSVGTTYKVVTDGGDVVVVKRVRQRRRRRDVDGWLRIIGGLRHANVVCLLAYYNSKEELLLVYEFLPNGSLHSLLHGNRGPGRMPLSWRTRLKLASEAAKGLAFIHGNKKAKILHGHLTSSNILVNNQGNAGISDSGLHQVLYSPSPTNDDYKAPELKLNNGTDDTTGLKKYTQKCDIYSFGVILLEMLSGKTASGNGEGGMSLVKWVQSVGKEEWGWEVFDFEMLGDKVMENEMVGLMQVALLCVATLPKDRPMMSVVHGMIEDIRGKSGRNGGNGMVSILDHFSSDSSPSQSERTLGL